MLLNRFKIFALFVVLTVSTSCRHSNDDAGFADNQTNSAAITSEELGIMSRDDYIRLRQIGEVTDKTGVINEGDIDWLVSLPDKVKMPQGMHSQDDLAKALASVTASNLAEVGGVLSQAKSFPSSRSEKLFQFAVRLVNTDEHSGLVKRCGADIFGTLKNLKAKPYLQLLLKDSRPKVQKSARSAIAKLTQ